MLESRGPYLAFGVCAVVWSTTYLAIRIGQETLAPLWSLFLRQVVAACILSAILLLTRQRLPQGVELKAAVLYGIAEFGLSMPLLYFAEKSLSSGLAALLFATCPITAMFLGAAFHVERLTFPKLLAGVAALFGLATVFQAELHAGSSAAGIVMGLGAAIVAVFGNIALKKAPKLPALSANVVASLIGILASFVLSLLLREPHVAPTASGAWGSVLYLAVMSSVIAFSLAVWLLSKWAPSTVAFLGVITPTVAMALGAAVAHERILPTTLLGGVVVMVSVAFALRFEAREGNSLAH